MFSAGEDRWLCTLLMKQGWRVEYNAASDAYTNAPEDFKELYNQVSVAADQNIPAKIWQADIFLCVGTDVIQYCYTWMMPTKFTNLISDWPTDSYSILFIWIIKTFRDIIYNISAFLCLKLTEVMVCILLIFVLGLCQMFCDNVQTQTISCK